MNLQGAKVWIVGASSGIGAAVATELVNRGARVAITARREEKLRELSGGRMVVAAGDVTDRESLRQAYSRVTEELGATDAVLVFAGYWQQGTPATWDPEIFQRHVQVNLLGLSEVLGLVVPDMVRRHRGTIGIVASVAGYRGLSGAGYYAPTKAAQLNLADCLRADLAAEGIKILSVAPGFVRTEMTAENSFPMPFIIEPREAAQQICDALAHDRADLAFPLPMAVAMKAARFVPTRLWSLAVRRRP